MGCKGYSRRAESGPVFGTAEAVDAVAEKVAAAAADTAAAAGPGAAAAGAAAAAAAAAAAVAEMVRETLMAASWTLLFSPLGEAAKQQRPATALHLPNENLWEELTPEL